MTGFNWDGVLKGDGWIQLGWTQDAGLYMEGELETVYNDAKCGYSIYFQHKAI